MDEQLANLPRFPQAYVQPGRTAVVGSVDTVSVVGAVAEIPLAGADIHDVVVGRCDRDIADRRGLLIVEDRCERCSVVDRLPQSARPGSDVIHVRILLRQGEGNDPAALPRRADFPVVHPVDNAAGDRLPGNVGGDQDDQEHKTKSGPPQRRHQQDLLVAGVPRALDFKVDNQHHMHSTLVR